jgi:hypothetical protein
MANVWHELAKILDFTEVKAIVLRMKFPAYEEDDVDYILGCSIQNFQDEESYAPLQDFHEKFDVEYDSGYGSQELYGTIWMLDGTWWSRCEYDGSEWWEHHVCPEYDADLHTNERSGDPCSPSRFDNI